MAKKKRSTKKPKKSRYLFKITVVGPEDNLLEDFLQVINENVVAVDGIRIVSGDIKTDNTDVKALIMSPKHAAMDVLLSVTFKGANAAIIVLRDSDPELEALYRNEVREQLGTGVPTRVVTMGQVIDEFTRNAIVHSFDDLVEEIIVLKGIGSNDNE
ncbi:MAG: hypothetical protein ACXADL_02385 [Candidatus Thorarchaeota archaeon]|jgi:hypothetical protein